MRAGTVIFTMVCLLYAVGAVAGSASKTEKDATILAKAVEGGIIKKKDETVRVETKGCQISIEFTSHKVTFSAPLRGSRIMESDNADGVVLVNSEMTRKFRDRPAEPYDRLYLRFDRTAIEKMVTHFQQMIRACET